MLPGAGTTVAVRAPMRHSTCMAVVVASALLASLGRADEPVDTVQPRVGPRLTLLGGVGGRRRVDADAAFLLHSAGFRIDGETAARAAVKGCVGPPSAGGGNCHFISAIVSVSGAAIRVRDLGRYQWFRELQLVPGVRWTLGSPRARVYLDGGLGGFWANRTPERTGPAAVGPRWEEPELNLLGRLGLGVSFDVGPSWGFVFDLSGLRYYGPRGGNAFTTSVGVSFSLL